MNKIKQYYSSVKVFMANYFEKARSPWGKTTTLAIVGFLILLMLAFGNEDVKAESRTNVEVSAFNTSVGGKLYNSETLMINEEFDKKYVVGIGLQIRLDCRNKDQCSRGESERSNQFIYIERVVYYKKLNIGIGISYWKNHSPAWNSNTPFVLSFGYDFAENFSLGYKHFSTGGSSSSNGGMDMIGNLIYRF